jgi:transcription elongation factor Elf1
MHQSLGKLKTEARKSATNAGHTMGPFHTIKRATKRTVAEALCVKCGAYVQVDTNPPPNGIDISGDVFGKTCSG